MNFFPVQEPPPGGLTRLRARLDTRRRAPIWWVPVAVVVVMVLVMRPRVEPLVLEPSAAAYALGLVRAPSSQVVLASSAPMAALTEPTARVQVFEMMAELTHEPAAELPTNPGDVR